MTAERIDHGTVTPGTIEFTMSFGGGETAGRLQKCIQSGSAIPRDLLDYVNSALGLMVPGEMLARSWHVDRIDYRSGKTVTLRVFLTAIN